MNETARVKAVSGTYEESDASSSEEEDEVAAPDGVEEVPDEIAIGLDGVEHLIQLQDVDDAATPPVNKRQGVTPTYYTMLLFHQAFCEYAFNDNYEFILRNDPYYGRNTFGQVSRLMPERAAVMHQKVHELMDGGWRNKEEFKPFLEALDRVPESGTTNHKADKQFYTDMVETFLRIFNQNYDKHIMRRWTNNKLIVYMLGGEPELAKQLARVLDYYDQHNEDRGLTLDEDGNTINSDIPTFDTFPGINIDLGDHHTMNNHVVNINVRDTMRILTKGKTAKDWWTILDKDRFVKKCKGLIIKLARSSETVRLFDRRKDGELHDLYSLCFPICNSL